MEGALAGRLSMTFQTLKVHKLGGQFLDMLLHMLYIVTYLTDGVARADVIELHLTLSCSAVLPERLPERRGGFGGKTLHDISNMENTDALGPIFRYVAQYVLHSK